jgi:hypothetical protein
MQGVMVYMALLAFMLLGGIAFWFGYRFFGAVLMARRRQAGVVCGGSADLAGNLRTAMIPSGEPRGVGSWRADLSETTCPQKLAGDSVVSLYSVGQ